MDKKLTVSIVIPTLNSERYLADTLQSISKQTQKVDEIIIVDGGSTDGTQSIVKSFEAKFLKCDRGRSKQKNYGAKHSFGDCLYFVDDDFVLDERIVEEAIEQIKQGFDMVAVHNTSDGSVSFWAKVRKFERDMLKFAHSGISPRFLTRKAFMSVNGFNENMVAGEDYDIFNRLQEAGFKMSFINSEETHLGEPKRLADIAKKHFFYGSTLANKSSAGTPRKLTFWQKVPIKPAYVRNLPRFIKHPILSIGFIIYQIVRYTSAAFGYVFGKIASENSDQTFR
ncbi:MAG: glycosyltransferase [Candidatus Dojkabacteria bacterium]|uniref:Glycosyltransferase n=1 Tax=Candidatus Dojkabacteria bacterium TaxID=2099670 RepID=A0A952AJ87_9BACT|nr:glycosyltransferase [Candidatus Dojkabacteria bacterium]WKZ28483.1 MAG: glycosyltransferase [Candidatus Dojkabacteria bacterium]